MIQFVEAWVGLYAIPVEDGRAFPDRRAGQGLIEYGLILMLVAIIVFASVVFLRERLIVMYSKIGNSIP